MTLKVPRYERIDKRRMLSDIEYRNAVLDVYGVDALYRVLFWAALIAAVGGIAAVFLSGDGASE